MSGFPPPDPHEQALKILAEGMTMREPTAVFTRGPASPEADRIADRVLDARPGLFIVLADG